MPELSPLTQDHCDLLCKVQQSVPAALELAELCSRCGLDMTREVEQLKDQQQRADAIKQTFFPGHE